MGTSIPGAAVSNRLTARIGEIRSHTASFLGAGHDDEIVFTAGATAALNAVALSWALSFTPDGIGSSDLGFVPAEHGFPVRTGAHCVPARELDAEGDSVRVSTHIYTTVEEIDRFTACVASVAEEIT